MKRLCYITLLMIVFTVCSFNNFVLAKNDYVTVAPNAIFGWAIYTDTKVQVGYISSKYVQSGMQYVVGGYTDQVVYFLTMSGKIYFNNNVIASNVDGDETALSFIANDWWVRYGHEVFIERSKKQEAEELYLQSPQHTLDVLNSTLAKFLLKNVANLSSDYVITKDKDAYFKKYFNVFESKTIYNGTRLEKAFPIIYGWENASTSGTVTASIGCDASGVIRFVYIRLLKVPDISYNSFLKTIEGHYGISKELKITGLHDLPIDINTINTPYYSCLIINPKQFKQPGAETLGPEAFIFDTKYAKLNYLDYGKVGILSFGMFDIGKIEFSDSKNTGVKCYLIYKDNSLINRVESSEYSESPYAIYLIKGLYKIAAIYDGDYDQAYLNSYISKDIPNTHIKTYLINFDKGNTVSGDVSNNTSGAAAPLSVQADSPDRPYR